MTTASLRHSPSLLLPLPSTPLRPELELLMTKQPNKIPPKIVTSNGGLRDFGSELTQNTPFPPKLELLGEDFVSWTGVWTLPLHPPRIPSHLAQLVQFVTSNFWISRTGRNNAMPFMFHLHWMTQIPIPSP